VKLATDHSVAGIERRFVRERDRVHPCNAPDKQTGTMADGYLPAVPTRAVLETQRE